VIAGEVAEHGFSSLKAPIVQVTGLDATIPYSEPLEAWVMPNEDKIVAAVQRVGRTAPVTAVMAAPPARRRAGRCTCLATMWRIRLFEERVGRLKRADEVHGLIHLSVGQEGVAAACARSCATTTPCTRATAPTGTRSQRARRSTARSQS